MTMGQDPALQGVEWNRKEGTERRGEKKKGSKSNENALHREEE